MKNDLYEIKNKTVIFKNGITYIPENIFRNNKNIKKVIMPNSVKYIGPNAFNNCENLKQVVLSKNIIYICDSVFANCKSLEKIDIPPTLVYLPYKTFYNCINLKEVNITGKMNYIFDYAFYNCKSLTNFKIPEDTTSVGYKTFFRCESIKELFISKNLNNIESSAFGLMTSLEKIIVDEENPKYKSDENVALFETDNGIIIQYALNNKNKEYVVGYYPVTYKSNDNNDQDDIETYELLYGIGDYAFAGSKYLEKISIPSELESVSNTSFLETKKLKTLNIFYTNFGKTLGIKIHGLDKDKNNFPFTEVIIPENITDILNDMSPIFKNIDECTLPTTLETLGTNTLTKSSKLKSITLEENIKTIETNSFPKNIILHFKEFGNINSNDFIMLQTKVSEDIYLKTLKKDQTKILSLKDGNYIVKIDDYEPVKISKDNINNLSNKSYLLSENPDKFIRYLSDIISINSNQNNLLLKILKNDSTKEIFSKFINDIDYLKDLTRKKNQKAINEILKAKNINDEIIFNGLVMNKYTKEDILLIANNMNKSLIRFFKYNNLFNDDEKENKTTNQILGDINKVVIYTNLLEKYKIYDRFLYNPTFYKLNENYIELILSNYNKNLKRVIKESKTLNNIYNLNDLIKFLIVMGCFSNNEILTQSSLTFIRDNLFTENINLTGDKIHTLFNEININQENDYDLELISLIKENYKELINLEKENSGIISKIINSFSEIKETSSSSKGNQRHLKVTLKKCLDFFLISKFDNYSEENYELAALLSKYYSDKGCLEAALKILDYSSKAPRNIFTKKQVINNIIVYDNNPDNDLKRKLENGLSYEWLPKQDYENFILGKYANCCAHLEGHGAGIMRASMTLDNVQNLVIKNKEDKIIAKMTLYVNKEQGYAVFNTAEISLNYKKEDYKDIYEAFYCGTLDFIKEYNKNNKIKIKKVSIGKNRNSLKDELEKHNKKIEVLYETPDYSKYSYIINGKEYGKYPGDSSDGQILVYKKKK
jgi:hypothetical protein